MNAAPPGEPPTGDLPPRPARSVLVRLPTHLVWLTYTLLGAIGLVFLGQLALAPFPGDVDPIMAFGAKVNELIYQGEWWRLITPIFVHGSVLHFVFNAYALYSLGREVERFYGGLRFGVLFFFAGVCGSTASLLLSPAPSVGASGAIFGLIGAEGVLLYRNRDLLGQRAQAGLRSILFIAAINLFIGFQSGLRIDNWAHLGGLAGGLMMAWLIGPVWAPDEAAGPVNLGLAIGQPPVLVDRQPLSAARWLGILGLGAGLLAVIGAIILLRR